MCDLQDSCAFSFGLSNTTYASHLETECICELVITGRGNLVKVARVRLLAMLDKLVQLATLIFDFDFPPEYTGWSAYQGL